MITLTKGARDRGLIAFLYYSGARVGEVARLQGKDLQPNREGQGQVTLFGKEVSQVPWTWRHSRPFCYAPDVNRSHQFRRWFVTNSRAVSISSASTRSCFRVGTTVRNFLCISAVNGDCRRPWFNSEACAATRSSIANTVSQLSTIWQSL